AAFGADVAALTGDAKFTRKSEIPYVAYYSFEERVAVRDEKPHAGLLEAYQTLSHCIARLGVEKALLREVSTHGRVTSPRVAGAGGDPMEKPDGQGVGGAIATLDYAAVKSIAADLCGRIAESEKPPSEEIAYRLLSSLLRAERYDEIKALTDALEEAGVRAP